MTTFAEQMAQIVTANEDVRLYWESKREAIGVLNPTDSATLQGLVDDLANLTSSIGPALTAHDSAGQAALAAVSASVTTTLATFQTALDTQVADAVSAILPTGSVVYMHATAAPTGFIKANGADVSRTTFADLFSVVGTDYGVGDGSTTFALPDLRAGFVRGLDDGRGVDVGRVLGTAQTDQLQGFHIATVATSGATLGTQGRQKLRNYNNKGVQYVNNNNSWNASLTGHDTAYDDTSAFAPYGPYDDGANGPVRTGTETRPNNVALLACIRY